MKKARYSDRYFEAIHSTGLGKKAAKSGVVSLVSQCMRFIVQLVSIVVLARLISPEDFGLIGMVSALIVFLNVFRDMGMTQATVQRESITRDQISTLFWINGVISLVLSLAVVFAAPLVAEFYGRGELIRITMILGGCIFVEGLGIQHRALLMRVMNYGKIVIVEITSQVMSITVAVIFALEGAGYWSLVARSVAQALCVCIGYMVLSRWCPSRPRWRSGVGPFYRFGLQLLGSNMLGLISKNLDSILIGKYIGSGALGFYSKSKQLLVLPATQVNLPIGRVALSMLSRLRHDADEFREKYMKMLLTTSTLTYPMVIFMVLYTEDVVALALGDQWGGLVPVFQGLAGSALMMCSSSAPVWLFVPSGRAKQMLYLNACLAVCNITAVAIALPYGIVAVAWSISTVAVLLKWPVVSYAAVGSSVSFIDYLKTQMPPFFISLIAAAASYLMHLLCVDLVLWLRFMLVGTVYVLVYVLIALNFRGYDFLRTHVVRIVLEQKASWCRVCKRMI